jgi:alpha-tubulin suppressor-like RCC1 family protein
LESCCSIKLLQQSNTTLGLLVLRRDGSVALWSNAQIPSGGTTVAVTATDVAGLSNIVSVAKTNNASVAVEADGSLWTWGNPGADTELGAGHGQAGNAVIGSPSLLSRLSGAKEASCSYIHCAVRLTNGQLWSWAATAMVNWATEQQPTASRRCRPRASA